MEYVSRVLKGKRLTIIVRNPRHIPVISRVLKDLGVRSFEIFRDYGAGLRKEAALRIDLDPLPFPRLIVPTLLAYYISGSKIVEVGIDPGRSNIGLAVVVGDILAYWGIFHSEDRIKDAMISLLETFGDSTLIVKIGITRSTREVSQHIADELRRLARDYAAEVRIIEVPEDSLGRVVVDKELEGLGICGHALSALKIILWRRAWPLGYFS